MARTGLAILGAVIGATIGAPFGQPLLGAQIGFAIGSGIGAAVFPEKGPVIVGPRLRDLDVQSSSYGLPIPIVFGTTRLAGNIIWATQIKETRREDGGGKGGGGGSTQVTFTYSIDCAIAICEGPIIGIRKIWGDTKLIWSIGEPETAEEKLASLLGLAVSFIDAVEAILEVQTKGFGAMRIYPGTQTAEPDPLIEADKGVGDVPAYRGLCYVVFDDFQLANFGNRIPNFSFEVVFAGTQTTAELDSVTIPDSGATSYRKCIGSFVDNNGEMVLLCDRGINESGNESYTPSASSVPKFKVMRSLGTSLFELPKVPAPIGSTLADPTQFFVNVRKVHMDHSGYALYNVNSPTASWIADWDTQTFTEFDFTIPFAIAQRGGEVLMIDNGIMSLFTNAGSFIATTTKATSITDIGISENFFWQMDQSGGIIRQISKSNFSVLNSYTVTGGSGANFANMEVVNDTLIFISQSPFPTADSLRVWRLEIDGAMSTTSDFTGGAITMTPVNGNEAVDNFFHVAGSLIIFGGRAPSLDDAIFNFIAISLTSTLIPLSTIVSNLCVNAGLKTSQIDITALISTNVAGYAIAREVSTRQALLPLQTAFSFDGVESDGKIKFVKRGGTSIETIPETQLAARAAGAEIPDLITTRRTNEKELPNAVVVSYADNANDHQQGMQRATRLITKSELVSSIELAISMTDDEARQIADILLYQSWLTRHLREINLSRRYLFLDPGDVITVPTTSATFELRIGEITFEESGVLTVRGVDESAATFSSGATGGISDPTQTPPGLIGSTALELLDLPLLRDQDNFAGFYAAARGLTTIWPGCVLFKSLDGGESFNEIQPILNNTPMGAATTVLASGPTTIFDEVNTVTVRLIGGTLNSDSEINVLNGANACVIGKEILQFKIAALDPDGSYDLSGLLRARRGTEQHIGTHATGDTFVLLQSSSVNRITNSLGELNIARIFKAPTIGLALIDADQVNFTDTGASLKPLSVVHVTVTRNVPAAGDITIAWIRRTRIGPEWRDAVDVPLGEAAESYSIDVFNNGTIVRTLTSTSESVVYLSADQTTDGFTPPRDPLHIKLYQISADVGRGFENDFTG